ncbi:Uncharacterised protein [Vibrio cholerae]|nr:Uncharacterised protein [Vibrio cholerae]
MVWSTRDNEASIRIMICSAGISSEKISTGLSCSIAAFSHRFIAKVVLPIEGRAATMIRSEPCKPAVFLFRSVKPVFTPVTPSCGVL